MTLIEDTLTYANGQLVNGKVVVYWDAFTVGGMSIAGGMLEWEIVAGLVEVELYANVAASPQGSYYTAKYELENGRVYTETWIVPGLPQVTIGQVRVGFPPSPSAIINPLQLTNAGAQPGMFLQWSGTAWIGGFVTATNIDPNYIRIGISGTPAADLSVTGSPVELGNGVLINVPDADILSRGVVTTGAQIFGGVKTFANNVTMLSNLSVAGSVTAGSFNGVTQAYNVNGVLVGARAGLNLIAGENVAITGADNAGLNRVDVTIDLLGGGDLQTPWLSNIDGGGFTLANAGKIGIGVATVPANVALRVSAGSSGIAPGAGPVIFAESNFSAFVEVATSASNFQCGYIFSCGASLTSYIIDANGEWTFLSAARPVIFNLGNAERMRITSAGLVGIGVPAPAYSLDVVGNVNVSGEYLVNGVPIGGGGGETQTPWLSNINAASFNLNSVGGIGISAPASTAARIFVQDTSNNAQQIYLASLSSPGAAGVTLLNNSNVIAGVFVGGSAYSNPSFQNALVLSTQAAYPVVFGTQATERMRITAAGNVGIGNSAPLTLLEVNSIGAGGEATAHGAVMISGYAPAALSQSANAGLEFNNSTAGFGWLISPITVGNIDLAIATRQGSPNWTERMRITSAGNVGIGTTSPGTLLEIDGATLPLVTVRATATTTTPAIQIQDAAATPHKWWLASGMSSGTDGTFAIYDATGPGARLAITPAGFVGIGTTSPPANLSVLTATNTSPSITYRSASSFSLDMNSIELAIGSSGTAPNPVWLQARLFNNTAMPLVLNPLGGNVGIGTTTPGALLDVTSTQASTPLLNVVNLYNAGGSELTAFIHSDQTYQGSYSGSVLTVTAYPNGSNTGGGNILQVGTSLSTGASLVPYLVVKAASGNVGIGTAATVTNPLSPLSIIAPTPGPTPDTAKQFAIGEGSNNSAYRLTLGYYNDGAQYRGVIQATNAGPALGTLLLQPLGGSVGIGTTTPAANLDISSTTQSDTSGVDQKLAFSFGTSPLFGWRIDGTNSSLCLDAMWTAWNIALRISRNSGFLSLGPNLANYRLDVAGDCNVTGVYRVNGAPFSGGGITVQSVVTGSRNLTGSFQNTTGKPMWVAAAVTIAPANSAYGYTDAASTPTTAVSSYGNAAATNVGYTISFWVLPGNYYRIVSMNGGALNFWTEWY